MRSTVTIILAAAAAIPAVLGHAGITSPPIRQPGNAFLQKCGQTSFNSVKGDPTGHIEEQEPVNAGCDLTLCRGMLFQDQPASNVQKVTPGQQMTMGVDCTIPHGGPANVSLIDTTAGGSGAVIGSFLKTFDNFCPTSGGTPPDQSNLQFNLPSASEVGTKCQNAGDCVVQLFWATPDFSQNYYYCVDVAMNNAASAPSSTAAAVSSSAVAASSSAAVASSSAPATTIAIASSAAAPAPASSSTSVVVVAPSSSANPDAGVATVIVTASPTPDAAATSAADATAAPITSVAVVGSQKMVTVFSTSTAEPQSAATALGAVTSGARRRMRLLWLWI
ncbi:hypothetical protein PUNSTDRAFT_111414 [Punctularia strigosozonata HHB-11173 SS5]|uniref:uncharacterized protein n=1 Tax=Punctularia strigosozonata (strain HHB-11173) TaxID=741275 RepID=UPI000441639E|nr:uncharacterized protein PUNSTDRAFT_111414 [Punctularia strigosozonata HHB-11173 SS5]EIN11151.1 hypothetical protein PUNSTDRAFT_111414 [Punctularia strigosozonata HHB-11173 SS5]